MGHNNDFAFDPPELKGDVPEFEPPKGNEPRVVFYEDNAGEHRWKLVAGNHEIMTGGTEGYDSASGAETALRRTAELLLRLGYGPNFGAASFDLHSDYPDVARYLHLRAERAGDAEAIRLLEDL